MIEGNPIHDPIIDARNSLPFVVRDYLELGDEVNHAHDEQHRQELSRVRLGLITDISKDPNQLQALTEFVVFQSSELKKRGEIK